MDKDKEIYNSRICKYCEYNNVCSKDKYKVFTFAGKVTMRCKDYSYINSVLKPFNI